MNQIYLLIGGNLGNRLENLEKARTSISANIGRISESSPVYETAAWGLQEQPAFLNQVLLITSPFTARETLKEILAIEHEMGRERSEKFGPRIIDIDILFFNHDIVHEQGLSIPHPQLHLRRFTLQPLNDIAPQFVHPELGKPINELLATCPDPLTVKKL